MGKIRVKDFASEEAEAKQQEEAKKRHEERIAAEKAKAKSEENAESAPEAEQKETKTVSKYAQKKVESSRKQSHSQKYLQVATQVERNKMYSLSEALELLPKLTLTKFDETVELHLNTTDTGISGQITLPHGTGKQVRVVIATDAIISEIENGSITFDVLIAEPSMMPKLAKVAKILGPRGLMPNPKNGTVSPKPEEVAKKFEGGQMNFKTEAKFPVLHLVVGKVSFGDKKLSENIKVAISAVQTARIKNATLKSTMSPGLKLNLATL